MIRNIYEKALDELSKRVDFEENPNYIVKTALEYANVNHDILRDIEKAILFTKAIDDVTFEGSEHYKSFFETIKKILGGFYNE